MFSFAIVDSTIQINPIIQDAIFAIRDETDLEIVTVLLTDGPLSFSELKSKLKLHQTILDRKLDKLMNSALVNHFYSRTKDSKRYSFYECTALAKDLLDKFYEIQTPRPVVPLAITPFYIPGSDIVSFEAELTGMIEAAENIKKRLRFRHFPREVRRLERNVTA